MTNEEKIHLVMLILERVTLIISEEKLKRGMIAVCATGLDSRMRRSAHLLARQLTEEEIISLALELEVLDRDLIDKAEKECTIQETKKRELLNMIFESAPLPYFRHRKAE